ncbi:hypothetical protein ACP26L_03635 [Paenibacillus sp. S-38]|uniref:hypothetical protein n=1 Tax=Paenibacillus sp. S-38 TaxID=3416710 RepID=UPI003CE9F3E6
MKKRNHTFTLALVLAGAAALAAGCSADTVTLPTPDGGKAVISSDKEMSTITTDKGKMTLSGENQLPEGFPKEIPIPDKAAIQASMKSEGKDGGEVYTVAYEIEQPFEKSKNEVEAFFKSSGYTESTRLTDESIFLIAGKKDGLSLHFTVSKDMESDRKTAVTIVHEANK